LKIPKTTYEVLKKLGKGYADRPRCRYGDEA